ncbi:MAG: Hypothetical protein AJITA_00857 [Acetilactobacillus jinshanensis]
MTTKTEKKIIQLILGSLFGYGCCSTLPKIPQTNGWSTFPPQAVGMIVSAVLLALILKSIVVRSYCSVRRPLKTCSPVLTPV